MLNLTKWLFEKYLNVGRRVRKTFTTKGEALAYESYIDEQAAVRSTAFVRFY